MRFAALREWNLDAGSQADARRRGAAAYLPDFSDGERPQEIWNDAMERSMIALSADNTKKAVRPRQQTLFPSTGSVMHARRAWSGWKQEHEQTGT